MGVIYKLTFANGKVYVGMTTVSVRKRMYCHEFKSRSDNPNLSVHRAWKKYGKPDIEILAEVDNSCLAQTEINWIKTLGSFGEYGYNMTPGGEDSPMKVAATVEKVRLLASTPERIARNIEVHKGSKRSKETCEMFSQMRKGQNAGIPKTPEHRRKISEANKGKPKRVGFTHSLETRLKLSISNKASYTPERRLKMSELALKREAKKRELR